MTKTTKNERLATMEQQIRDMKEDITEIKEITKGTNAKLDALDNKYANKNVERIVYGMLTIIVIAFLYAVIHHFFVGG